MLPSLTERDIEAGLRSFIEREFPIATPTFHPGGVSVVDSYIEKKGNFIQGPWLEIRRPFRKISADMKTALPHLSGKWGIASNWVPYAHQLKAFERLAYPNPKSTIVATGTGSGKTECFLFPVIDAVLRMNAEKIEGIKAIVIYPMNALATDQARRFASFCEDIVKAGGPRLSVGLYTGNPGTKSSVMQGENCITDREVLRSNPPDILLTNYKMLDFLLLRREDRALWRTITTRSLRYLIVDELHTFDGAQGTDLACLIRRLRDFLNLGDELACVGTSATLGAGDGLTALKRYASDVFGADFTDDASVIREDRLSFDEYLDTFGPRRFEGRWPTYYQFRAFKSLSLASPPERFATEAYQLWFGRFLSITENDKESWTRAAYQVGENLPHLEAFQRLMRTEETVVHVETLARDWKTNLEVLKDFPHEDVVLLIRSLAALVSMARLHGPKDNPVPFLSVRVQFWMRELSKMLATVEYEPKLVAHADTDETTPLALPLVTCRDCNATGWGTVIKDGKASSDPDLFYRYWFAAKPDTAVLYPVQLEELTKYRKLFKDELVSFDTKRQEIRWIGLEEPDDKVWEQTLSNEHGVSERIIVRKPKLFDNKSTRDGVQVRMKTVCPWCGGENTMRLFGARSTTLSSALFGHLNSSPSNDDHKLIAFSDSVQDAAHRAGFIEARNYLYTVRQATAGVIRQIRPGERQSLEGLLNRITDHWLGLIGKSNELRQSTSALIRERADDIAAARFVTTFVPSDMLWRRTWLSFAERASDLWQSPAKGGFNPKNDNAERLYAIVPPLTEHDESGRPDTYWGKFVKHVQARLRWEAFIELTLRSHSGRTLELAGIGAVEPDTYLIKEAAVLFQKAVFERVGSLRDKPLEDFERFITGFLIHQKSRGAFDVSGVPGLEDFVRFTETGNDWVFNNSPSLPTYGKRFRPPAPLVMRPLRVSSKGFFDTICPASFRSETWYTVWLTTVFGAELDIVAGCEDIYGAMLDALRELDVVRFVTMTTQNGADVYLLNPQVWYVSRDLERAVCPDCGRWHVVERNNDVHELWRGMPCLSKQCNATSHRIEPFREEEALYQGTPFRATAREHTANVPGETRGRIERSFIHGKEPWDVNLLSATPTLEMGIDIGDLSSVLLGSMPPKEASYQQRIGRAGRRDGNALAMTICSNDAHSNYFWTDPDKMLAGAVEPPGVFLHAMAVLERQLFALAITRWMTAYPSAEIPETLDTILKEKKWDGQTYAPDSFPMGFLDYAMNEAETLHRDFCALFTQKENAPDGLPMQFSAEEKERLRQFLVGDTSGRTSLRDRLLGKLRRIQLQRESYDAKRKDYQNALRRRQRDPQDEERDIDIEELKQSITALSNLISSEFAKKQTLNMLTDEGLLPNYAFPEEGITIDSMVITLRNRKRKKEDEGKQDAKEKDRGIYKRFTFQRAASSGLTEVAPENDFYINEFILHVDQVDLGKKELQRWRFCPNCQYSAPEDPVEHSSACPRCGSPAWRESSQTRDVLPLRTVYAWADIRDDRIKDDTESRKALFQTKKLLVDFTGKSENKSFVMDGAGGFGFEYRSSVTLRDFNFGTADKAAGEVLEVGGNKVMAPGFTVCKECGRVKQDERQSHNRAQHDYDCPYAKNPEKAEWLDGLVLYREYQSEALRIRLPSGLFAAQYHPKVLTASLTAALRLGLKHYFHGSVDHLHFTVIEEPDGDAGKRNYVLVYDTVPGGTGYLKELMSVPENLIGVLRKALTVMTNCDCGGDPEAKGCYKCVYQYRDAASRALISKLCAIDVLTALTSDDKTIRKGDIDGGNGNSDGDSELEARFIRALGHSDKVTELKRCQEGIPHYLIRMKTGKLWRMDLQVDFTGDAPSRPDFVLRPMKEAERTKVLKMAIFTDGWRYHADIVREDCAKRQSLLNTGRRVWTLSWHDVPVEEEDPQHEDLRADNLLISPLLSNGTVCKLYHQTSKCLQEHGRDALPPIEKLLNDWVERKNENKPGTTLLNSFDRLLLWMEDPEKAQRAAQAFIYLRLLQCAFTNDGKPLPPVSLHGDTATALSAPLAACPCVGFRSSLRDWSSVHNSRTYRSAFYVDPEYFELHKDEPASSPASQSLRRFWATVNVASLADGVLLYPAPLPEDGSDPTLIDRMPWRRAVDDLSVRPGTLLPVLTAKPIESIESPKSESPKSEMEVLWEEAKDYLPDSLFALADELKQAKVSIDLENIGLEYASDEGGIETVFELYWPEAKVAVLFDPETAPKGIVALDAALSAKELAPRIVEALARK